MRVKLVKTGLLDAHPGTCFLSQDANKMQFTTQHMSTAYLQI